MAHEHCQSQLFLVEMAWCSPHVLSWTYFGCSTYISHGSKCITTVLYSIRPSLLCLPCRCACCIMLLDLCRTMLIGSCTFVCFCCGHFPRGFQKTGMELMGELAYCSGGKVTGHEIEGMPVNLFPVVHSYAFLCVFLRRIVPFKSLGLKIWK